MFIIQIFIYLKWNDFNIMYSLPFFLKTPSLMKVCLASSGFQRSNVNKNYEKVFSNLTENDISIGLFGAKKRINVS